jgi:hypothetical protein
MDRTDGRSGQKGGTGQMPGTSGWDEIRDGQSGKTGSVGRIGGLSERVEWER